MPQLQVIGILFILLFDVPRKKVLIYSFDGLIGICERFRFIIQAENYKSELYLFYADRAPGYRRSLFISYEKNIPHGAGRRPLQPK